jgi:hypothetical protein
MAGHESIERTKVFARLRRLGLAVDEAREVIRTYGPTLVNEAVDAGWEPSHRIEVEGLPVEYVMLLPATDEGDDGPAFNPAEWTFDLPADWEVVRGKWRFQGDPTPMANAEVRITEVATHR